VSDLLAGIQVLSFETRMHGETAGLIAKHGGKMIAAPSMKELPLVDIPDGHLFANALVANQIDVLILLTGGGTKLMFEAAQLHMPRSTMIAQLSRLTVVCRGPKPAAVLKSCGLRPSLTVPEPNTWRDILGALDRELSVVDRRVFLQEYGVPNPELLAGLAERKARVTPLKLYSWALPDDTGPLQAAVLRAVRGQAQIAMFTAARQIEHVLQVAGAIGLAPAMCRALTRDLVVASIGPVTSEALLRYGITPDIVPGHPKLGHLVLAIARRGRACWQEKQERILPTPSIPLARDDTTLTSFK
jgi:uroporphyrinogen-III synthase